MLCNRNSGRCYDILILHKDISWENQQKLLVLAAEAEGVTIRLLSVAAWGGRLPEEAGYYYTVEAVYRLLLLGDTFSRYLHILYLDCNRIVNGDVSRLYDTELGEAEIAVVSAEEFMVLSKTKRTVFFGGYPYNVDNYRTDALGMTGIIMLVLCVACFMGCDQKDVEDQVRNVTDSVDEHVIGVKNGYPEAAPQITYGDAFDNFFVNRTWKYFESTDGKGF